MLQYIPVLNRFAKLFDREQPSHDASLVLARLLSQQEMSSLPFDEGLKPSRRHQETRPVGVGVWLIPFSDDIASEDVDTKEPIPAVTCDLRRMGIGLLLPAKLSTRRLIVAVTDSESMWKFVSATVCHQSPQPGGWFRIGLNVDGLWFPSTCQRRAFRDFLENRHMGTPAPSCSAT